MRKFYHSVLVLLLILGFYTENCAQINIFYNVEIKNNGGNINPTDTVVVPNWDPETLCNSYFSVAYPFLSTLQKNKKAECDSFNAAIVKEFNIDFFKNMFMCNSIFSKTKMDSIVALSESGIVGKCEESKTTQIVYNTNYFMSCNVIEKVYCVGGNGNASMTYGFNYSFIKNKKMGLYDIIDISKEKELKAKLCKIFTDSTNVEKYELLKKKYCSDNFSQKPVKFNISNFTFNSQYFFFNLDASLDHNEKTETVPIAIFQLTNVLSPAFLLELTKP